MKVLQKRIPAEAEEYAVLHLHAQDAATDRLVRYLEQEYFRAVRLLCRKGDQTVPVDCESVCCIETEGEMLRVCTMNDVLTLPEQLYQVQRLLPQSFVQAARGVLVNLDRIECFEPLPNGLIRARLANQEYVYISRKYARELRERLKEGTL